MSDTSPKSETSKTKSRIGRTSRSVSRSFRTTALVLRKQLWIWPVIALGLLLVLGAWLRREVERPVKDKLRDELTTILNADVAALELWMSQEQDKIHLFAQDEILQRAVIELAGLPEGSDQTALLGAPAQRLINDRFQARPDRNLYSGFVVFNLKGRVLASDAKIIVGETPYDAPWLKAALSGKTTISPPFKSVVMLLDTHGRTRTGVPTMFILGPVRDAAGQQIAVAALRVRPETQYTRILQIAKMGDTGETYAVDRNGLMLSQSRFDDGLKQIGLLPDTDDQESTLTLEVRDPGVDMTQGAQPSTRRSEQPLTLMARELAAGKSGVNVDGYRDYRGVPVVGAWTWLEDAGFGVATEMDVAEAFQAIYTLRKVFWGLFTLVALGAIAIFVFTIIVARLNRLARQAALKNKHLGQYTLDEKIGAGGMGVVYRAHHEMLRRPTAVKLLDVERTTPDSIARFEREVKLTSQLNHPNTITIYDYGRTPEGIFYYAMELLSGLDLEGLVRQFGAQPEGRVVYILRQVCGSLAEAHSAGLIHRDIKPANIMLTARGGMFDMAKVLDFGLVKALDAKRQAALTASDSWTGTPSYLSPEAIETPDAIDARSDLYAVGAVGYFLLTATPVFSGASVMEVIRRQISDPVQTPSVRLGRTIAADLEEVLLRCLAKDSAQRPENASVLAKQLAACASAHEWNEDLAQAWWLEFFPELVGGSGPSEGKVAKGQTVAMKTPPPLSATKPSSKS